jgi:hypothetical protein
MTSDCLLGYDIMQSYRWTTFQRNFCPHFRDIKHFEVPQHYLPTRLHGVTTSETIIWILTTAETSNPTPVTPCVVVNLHYVFSNKNNSISAETGFLSWCTWRFVIKGYSSCPSSLAIQQCRQCGDYQVRLPSLTLTYAHHSMFITTTKLQLWFPTFLYSVVLHFIVSQSACQKGHMTYYILLIKNLFVKLIYMKQKHLSVVHTGCISETTHTLNEIRLYNNIMWYILWFDCACYIILILFAWKYIFNTHWWQHMFKTVPAEG